MCIINNNRENFKHKSNLSYPNDFYDSTDKPQNSNFGEFKAD